MVLGSFSFYYGSGKSEATQQENVFFDNLDINYCTNPEEEWPDDDQDYELTFFPRPITNTSRSQTQWQREPSQYELDELCTNRQRQALQTWYKRFYELIEYCEVKGDCNVPQKYKNNPVLGIWVNKQRMEKKYMDEGKRSSMTRKKVQKLENIGFQWGQRKGQHRWSIRYIELRAYHEQFGDCEVPTKYIKNLALGRWVSTQRSEYKKFPSGHSKQMTQKRIDLLNALGFKWVASK